MNSPKDSSLTLTAQRIRERWGSASTHQPAIIEPRKAQRPRNNGALGGNPSGISTYSGSDVTNTTSDFLGDWRSVDSWMRFDLLRIRTRSRQLERGNPWCRSFKHSAINNTLGSSGIKQKPMVVTSRAFGDNTEGVLDVAAGRMIMAARKEFESPANYTTRKRLHRQDHDVLFLSRLLFDGEVIMRKIKGFDNDFNFSWQTINPDYLDHNLNRIEPNGNITKMGVELDKDFKFPVAYWFLKRRPNDYFYNYHEIHNSLYYRVEAKDIHHVFLQTEDDEQTRGLPLLFAAAVNLFRMGKYEEAALVNATIGASKMGFFKKTIPDGFAGHPSELDDDGSIIDEVSAGSWTELPWNVEPVPFDPKYPDSEFEPFAKAMLRSIASCMGCSYMSLSGDLSDASFSGLRAGQTEEHEQWMQLQGFIIRNWKEPEYDEWIYRAILNRKINLPISKLDKFKPIDFKGRRWAYVNPVDDLKAKQMALAMRVESISNIIEEQGGDRDVVFAQIAKDKADLEALGIAPNEEQDKPEQDKPDNADKKN